MINDLRIQTEIIKAFKDLTSKEEKLFYYAFGVFQHKIKAIKNQTGDSTTEETSSYHDYSVSIPYSDIEVLQHFRRVDNNNYRRVKKALLNNSYFEIKTEGRNIVYFLYNSVEFNDKERKVEIVFNSDIDMILDAIDDIERSFTRITIHDLVKIKGDKELKLYLFALTIWRKQKNAGTITMKAESLNEILTKETPIKDVRRFFFNYISSPIKKLNAINGLTRKLSCKRKGDLITITVKGSGIKPINGKELREKYCMWHVSEFI